MTVITGVSGSGKSSLAFDTLFAEGQRRYVESLSTYARQFIARMPRPDVDEIDNIPPAIALEQKNAVKNARSTIGTATEINDFLRLLFSRAGELRCTACDLAVVRDTPASVARAAMEWPEGTKFLVMAEIELDNPKRAAATLAEVKRQGFSRIVVDGETIDMDEPSWQAPKSMKGFAIVVDRLVVRDSSRSRLAEAIPTAFRMGHGRLVLQTTEGERRVFHEDLVCNGCGRKFREPEPRLFSFANPLGACTTCQGFGRVTGLDWSRVIPDPTLSVADGAIAPWRGETGREMVDMLVSMNKALKVDLKAPWKDLPEAQRRVLSEGKGDWPGIAGYFAWLESKRYKVQARVQIARFRGFTRCPDCGGSRLTADARAVFVGGRTMADVCAMNVLDLRTWFAELKLNKTQRETAERALKEVRSRLDYLAEVGLGYLTLDRQTRTLSGGEAQRINLATALGGALTETLYVLDEPTVGLHPRDTERLVGILRRLTAIGNTVVIVEHDLDAIRAADWLIDIGPRAGEHGGRVVYQGTPKELTPAKAPESRTAAFLASGKRAARKPHAGAPTRFGRRTPTGHVRVKGAHENNLDYLTVDFPLGVLCAVTGVSGSGKSTLVTDCLWANWRRQKGDTNNEPGKIVALQGLEAVEDVILVDQEPIGRSSRSNAATYLKAYDGIRRLLADSPIGKRKNLAARDFSFNVEGGRCEKCEGTGRQVIDMQFLADVEVVCEVCDGRRFQERVLEAEFNGKNITAILDMTVEDAVAFFAEHPAIVRGLQPLADVGLGYLRLGQATNTLSGGEAQRLKLASHLAEAEGREGNLLLIFDEPTTGLHAADLEVLMNVFDRALDRGFSILAIEHNLELIRRADWIVDLGPEGGTGGGHIVAQGTPEDVAACEASLTGKHLRAVLKG